MMKNTTKNEMINGWNMSLFHYHGGYLSYGELVFQTKFVARFKYNKRDRLGFQKFLVNNFTPLEYFTRLMTEAPLNILKSAGYVSASEKRLRKQKAWLSFSSALRTL
jgi:hypothetical protein